MQKFQMAGAYPVTLFQRLPLWPLCRLASDRGMSVNTRAGNTNQMRQLLWRPSLDQLRLCGECCGDERGQIITGRLPYLSLYFSGITTLPTRPSFTERDELDASIYAPGRQREDEPSHSPQQVTIDLELGPWNRGISWSVHLAEKAQKRARPPEGFENQV